MTRSSCAAPATRRARSSSTSDGARVIDATDLWGLTSADAEARLRERLGPAYRVAAIGPAGERLVRFATVSHDGRHAGRGGLGAVMGSKRLKASRCARRAKCAVADPGPCSPPRRTCARARSAPPPPSTAAWARSRTCSRSTRSRRCRAQLRHRDDDARARGPRRGARVVRLVLDRLRADPEDQRRPLRARGVRERVRARAAGRDRRPRRGAQGVRARRRARHRHDLRRRHDRLGDGGRRRGLAALRRRRRRCTARSS